MARAMENILPCGKGNVWPYETSHFEPRAKTDDTMLAACSASIVYRKFRDPEFKPVVSELDRSGHQAV